jgi:hypothetical protein
MILAAIILALGVVVIALLYGPAYREYVKEKDGHGAEVTIIAATGSFLPFIFFAFVALELAHEVVR